MFIRIRVEQLTIDYATRIQLNCPFAWQEPDENIDFIAI